MRITWKSLVQRICMIFALSGALLTPVAVAGADVTAFPHAVCAAAGTTQTSLVSNRFESKLLLERGFDVDDLHEGQFSEGPVFLDAVGEDQMDRFFAASGVQDAVRASGIALKQIACFSFQTADAADSFAANTREGASGKKLVELTIKN